MALPPPAADRDPHVAGRAAIALIVAGRHSSAASTSPSRGGATSAAGAQHPGEIVAVSAVAQAHPARRAIGCVYDGADTPFTISDASADAAYPIFLLPVADKAARGLRTSATC